ncbi:MAG: hypothetical protein JNK67_32125 [Alphaproteobacteria bacterium]|nr:hypothetical protein [Alphaproteobacteria bacterium]
MARTTTQPAVRAVPTTVRRAIRVRLEGSPGFRAMPAEGRRQLADDTATLAAFADVTAKVDFPSFVAGLLKGVFDAMVDGSLRQTEAYVDLVQAVAKTVDRFVADPTQRSELAGALGDIFELCPDGSLALRGRCPKRRGPRGRAGALSRAVVAKSKNAGRAAVARKRR